MISRIHLCAAWLACLTAPVLAQYSGGVNVDFNAAAGAGAGQPSILFAGAGGQGGYWNPVNPPVNSGAVLPLRDLGNSANALQLSLNWLGGPLARNAFTFNNAGTSGDTELLMDDVLDLDVPANGMHSLSTGGFAVGLYRVVTYAGTPDSPGSRTVITVRTAQGVYGSSTVGGAFPAGNALVEGVTHSVVDVPLFGPGLITIEATPQSGFGAVNGFQIVPLNPTRLYVRTGVPGGAGLSWASPLSNLQQALAIARAKPSVTEIWVAGGTFYADEYPEAAGNRNAAFLMRSGLTVYGGFNGTEVGLSQRNPANPPTVLSGHSLAYHTVVCDNVSNVTIDGVTVADGYNDLDNHAVGYFAGGAGVFVENGAANITVSNCRFVNNQTPAGGGTCLYVANAGPVYADQCSTRDNVGEVGVFASVFGGSLSVTRCTLTGNRVTGSDYYSGSLLRSSTGGSLYVFNSLLANNDVRNYVVYASESTLLDMRNCTVANNHAPAGSPGIYGPNNTRMHNCILYGSTGPGPWPLTRPDVLEFFGGAGTPLVTDCIVQAYDGTFGTNVGNVDTDPRFTAPATPGAPAVVGTEVDRLGYRLASRSPARDSGWDGGTPPIINDLLGNPRLFDDPYFSNTGPFGSTVDRGCFEMQTPSAVCPGDLGAQGGVPGPDGLRDNNDFVVFINYFFTSDPRADLGSQGGVRPGDGLYDNNDFIVFIDDFFTACP